MGVLPQLVKSVVMVIVLMVLSGCISLAYRSPFPSRSLSPEEIAQKIQTLEQALSSEETWPEEKINLHLRLSYLYIHPSLKEKQYEKALQHLQSYIYFTPEESLDYSIRERLELLKEIVSLEKQLKSATENSCEGLGSELQGCVEQVDLLTEQLDSLKKEKTSLKKEIEELHKKIDQLLHIELQIEKKKKQLKEEEISHCCPK